MQENDICILIAEDEPYTREVLVHYIPWQELGITQVLEAGNGKAPWNWRLPIDRILY